MRLRGDRGATAVEYALGIALVATVFIGAVQFVEDEGTDKLDETDERVGVIEDTAAYQAPVGPGPPPPPPPPPSGGGTLAPPIITPADPASDNGGRWTAFATITVVDTSAQPVSGVTVSFRWSNGGPEEDCTTNSSGECSISQSVNDNTPAVIVTVEEMAKSGWTSPTLPLDSGGIPCSPPLDGSCDQV